MKDQKLKTHPLFVYSSVLMLFTARISVGITAAVAIAVGRRGRRRRRRDAEGGSGGGCGSVLDGALQPHLLHDACERRHDTTRLHDSIYERHDTTRICNAAERHDTTDTIAKLHDTMRHDFACKPKSWFLLQFASACLPCNFTMDSN